MVWVVFNSIFLGNVWDLNCVNKKKKLKEENHTKIISQIFWKNINLSQKSNKQKKNSKYHFAIEAGVSTSKAMTFA